MGGAAGPDFRREDRERMAHTLEGTPAASRSLGRRDTALRGGGAIRANGASRVDATGLWGEARPR